MSRKKALLTLLITLAIAWGSLGAMLLAGWAPKLGLDLQGGFAVVLVGPEGTDPDTLDTAVEIMRRRIEELGSVQEPEISVQGERSIVVQLPGVDDRERALEAVGTTGEMSFRPVFDLVPESPALTDPEGEHPDNLDPVTGLSDPDDVHAVIAYLPSEDGRITGLSKLLRVVEILSRRLQIQERLTAQIAREVKDVVKAEGVGVVMECRHLCMMMRGVEKQNSVMTTSSVLGSIHDEAETRTEFLTLIGRPSLA